MAEENTDEVKDITPDDLKDKNPLLMVVLLLNTLVMAGVGYMQYSAFQKEASRPALRDIIAAELKIREESASQLNSGEAREEDGILFPLDPFTANLAQGDGPRRYVRLNAVLKFSQKSSEEEFKARKPQIRDTIISTLNSKRPEDLLKVEGKNFLKEELKAALNTFLVDGEVIDIYYVGFQVK